MASPNSVKLTPELLRSYSEAALANAGELLVESSLLRDHGHYPRAYFLAIASIEEAGKALLSFDAQTRNLLDPAVCTKLKASMENHAQKITYALSMWAFDAPNQREAFKMALDLILHLQRGREPSMYSDLRSDTEGAQTPRQVVREVAARDCVRLAEGSLAYAHRHVSEKTPQVFSTAQNRFFTMKSGQFQAMLQNEDFWRYYITKMEAGQQDIAEAVLGYERDHIRAGTTFRQ